MEKLMVFNRKDGDKLGNSTGNFAATDQVAGNFAVERGGNYASNQNYRTKNKHATKCTHMDKHNRKEPLEDMWNIRRSKLGLTNNETFIEGYTVADFSVMDNNSVDKIFGTGEDGHSKTAHILQTITQSTGTNSLTRFNFASLVKVLQVPQKKKQKKSTNIYTWAPINSSIELATIIDNTKRVISKKINQREDSVKRNARFLKFEQKTPGEVAIWSGKMRNCKHADRNINKKLIGNLAHAHPQLANSIENPTPFDNFNTQLNESLLTPRFPRLHCQTQRSHGTSIRNADRSANDYSDMKFDLGVVKLPNISAHKQQPYPHYLQHHQQPHHIHNIKQHPHPHHPLHQHPPQRPQHDYNTRKQCSTLADISVRNARKGAGHRERSNTHAMHAKRSRIVILTPAPPPASPVSLTSSSASFIS